MYLARFRYCRCGASTQTLAPKQNRSLLKLKMTGKCLHYISQQFRSINFKHFQALSPHHGGGVGVSCDTKPSDFKYKLYPKKISGYVTESLTFNTYSPQNLNILKQRDLFMYVLLVGIRYKRLIKLIIKDEIYKADKKNQKLAYFTSNFFCFCVVIVTTYKS